MCKNIANISNNAEQLKPSFLLQPEIVDINESLSANDKTQVIVIQVPASSQLIANMLVHREYLNPAPTIIELNREGLVAKNANRPLKSGPVTLSNYERHPKNPHMANFFVQMGRAEHLGTGIRNLYKYVPIYTGKEPMIEDEDMYIVRMALPKVMTMTWGNTTEMSRKTQKWPEKAQQIIEAILHNAGVSIQQLEEQLQIWHTTIKKILREMQIEGIIRRVGPNKGGHWEIIDKRQ